MLAAIAGLIDGGLQTTSHGVLDASFLVAVEKQFRFYESARIVREKVLRSKASSEDSETTSIHRLPG
jgi:hypothetical protein